MTEPLRAAVVGAGAWGTALATVLVERGHDVTIWAYEPEVTEAIRSRHENPYLKGVRLPDSLRATSDIAASVRGADLVLSVSPSQVVRAVMESAASHIASDAMLVSASKGIEVGSLLRMDQVLAEVLPESVVERFCVLSGPSFAQEVAGRGPTAVVVASARAETAEECRSAFQTPWFRVYTNQDVVGVELGGALKNVVALAAGVTAGLGFGHNTTAALITRGLAEMARLGLAMGARSATFYGLAGLGDLVLTCTGSLSRNRTVGYRLGQGESLDGILSDMTAVAEGVETARSVCELARRHEVEMPIAEQVHAIVHEGKSAADAVRDLMSRDPKPEEWS
jgi:glycerol-3-phosphate dehydrogenase (NAD(P)+)